MMIAIKNTFLKTQFEKFRNTKETAQSDFWTQFDKSFGQLSEEEKEKSRDSWIKNMENAKKRMEVLKKELEQKQMRIQVFPNNQEERKLLEILLTKMRINFELG